MYKRNLRNNLGSNFSNMDSLMGFYKFTLVNTQSIQSKKKKTIQYTIHTGSVCKMSLYTDNKLNSVFVYETKYTLVQMHGFI